jgi:hypothetical protein
MALDGKYRVERIDPDAGTPLPDDEPVFVLRAQDMIAADMVRLYSAHFLRVSDGSPEAIETYWRILAIADRMDAWPIKKVPD